ncbi:hypothetical protein KEM56_004981, partial [Ascosphaera pollenicola]
GFWSRWITTRRMRCKLAPRERRSLMRSRARPRKMERGFHSSTSTTPLATKTPYPGMERRTSRSSGRSQPNMIQMRFSRSCNLGVGFCRGLGSCS